MTTPPRPGERRPRRPRRRDPARRLGMMWADVLRRFRDHLHTTTEDTDGRTP
jgi:hypothetical protein